MKKTIAVIIALLIILTTFAFVYANSQNPGGIFRTATSALTCSNTHQYADSSKYIYTSFHSTSIFTATLTSTPTVTATDTPVHSPLTKKQKVIIVAVISFLLLFLAATVSHNDESL